MDGSSPENNELIHTLTLVKYKAQFFLGDIRNMKKHHNHLLYFTCLMVFTSGAVAQAQNLNPLSSLWSVVATPPANIPTKHPDIGMSYADFSALTRSSGYGDPRAVTKRNDTMIYSLPNQIDIYFWFTHNRLEKITQVLPDDEKSWETNIISPEASIKYPLFQ